MHRTVEEINDLLDKFIDLLITTAMEDEILSSDEHAIIVSIKEDITNLQKQVIQILQDDLDESEFIDIIEQVFSSALENATRIAKADNIITEEEAILLQKLKEFVESGVLFSEKES
ncbi:MAG: hypothetical protein OEZ01_05275 [Candidatus Heimdallarchaeota archaeon]|nr:hypothetical protein [Candidatus Heimdallarchaeota archaeon]MDH5645394.1 hypothetical protein [Candidatus Heimdallarchaeota archaeon]